MKVVKLDDIDNETIKSSFEDVVVIPTETVYGLAARIDSDKALENIFKIKGRPSDNPLILHVSDIEMLKDIIDGPIPDEYIKLIENFWPGPLSLIFKCKSSISKIIRGRNNDTIAVRMPKNQKLRDIIKYLGVPLAAPSANTSGKPSPTEVEHVIEDLKDTVSLYIDDGPCSVGLESTVLGIIDGEFTILRPGGITKEHVENLLNVTVKIKNKFESNAKVLCPGQKYKHYSPEHSVYLFIGEKWKDNMIETVKVYEGMKIGLLKRRGLTYPIQSSFEFDLGESLSECSQTIFAGLRYLDKLCDVIFVVGFELEDEGLAIMDRIEKAATKIIK